MSKSFQQKQKILYVAQMLMEETDEKHPLSMRGMIAYLKHKGIKAEQKNLSEDLTVLQDMGMEIKYRRCRPSGYYLVSRKFEMDEVRILLELVHSSALLADNRKKILLQKLETLTSIHNARELKEHLIIDKSKKTGAEETYECLRLAYDAMDKDCQISFWYYKWSLTEENQLTRSGERLLFSPWGIVSRDARYYMIGIDNRSGIVKNCRLDRMKDVRLEKENRTGDSFFRNINAVEFATKTFGILGGNEEEVFLEFKRELLGKVVDHFGENIQIVQAGEEKFTVSVQVRAGKEFFGWLTGIGTDAKIIQPENILVEYKKYLKKILGNYGV